MVVGSCSGLGERRCRTDHTGATFTNEHLLSVHMCTALNLAITEHTRGGEGEKKGTGSKESGMWGVPLGS